MQTAARESSFLTISPLSSFFPRKMRSDSLINADPRAHVLVAPPGANPADYTQRQSEARGGGGIRRGGTRGRGGRRGGRR